MKMLLLQVSLLLVAKQISSFLVLSRNAIHDPRSTVENWSFASSRSGRLSPYAEVSRPSGLPLTNDAARRMSSKDNDSGNNGSAVTTMESETSENNEDATTKKSGFFRRMYNGIFHRSKQYYDELDSSYQEWSDQIDQLLVQKTDKLINDIAVEFCKVFVKDAWELAICSNTSDSTMSTKSSMDNTVAQLANVLLELGLAKGSKGEVEDQLKSYRFQWKQSFKTTTYPIQSEHTIMMGDTVFIRFYGKFHFDLEIRQITFQMDELKVLDVAVDLDQVMANATIAEGN